MMIRQVRLTVFVGILILLTGCMASGEANFDRYSLVDDVAPAAYTASYDVTVDVYGSLNEGGVVLRVSPVTLRPAKSHRWASELKDQLRIMVMDAMLKRNLGFSDSLRINVSHFEGDLEGNVLIEAVARITNSAKKVLFEKNLRYSSRQEDNGYPSLVQELRKGWQQQAEILAEDIAKKYR